MSLELSTYLGGSSHDNASGVALDAAGNAYVVGLTFSADYPTRTPLQAYAAADAFITKYSNRPPVWQGFFAVDTRETPYVGDFNGDGKTDIITFTRDNPAAFGDVYVALSDGAKFGANTKWHDFFAINRSEVVVVGDYDGDGKDDIATWLSTSTRQVYVARSLGTGMTQELVWSNSIGFDPSDVLASGDANGDGKKDLILFARQQGKVYVALSTGSSFAAPTQWHGFFAVSTYERPRVADVNGDGKDDIVTFATDSPTSFGDVYTSISTGTRFGVNDVSNKWHDFFSISPAETVRSVTSTRTAGMTSSPFFHPHRVSSIPFARKGPAWGRTSCGARPSPPRPRTCPSWATRTATERRTSSSSPRLRGRSTFRWHRRHEAYQGSRKPCSEQQEDA
jgi:hypothetical protein